MKLYFEKQYPLDRPPYIAVELVDGEIHGSIQVKETDSIKSVLEELQKIMEDMTYHSINGGDEPDETIQA